MSRGSRGAFRLPPGYDDLDDVASPREGEAQTTLDPAEIAADLMIDRMLAAPGFRAAVAAPGTAVVVLVPSREWLETISDSWRDTVRGGVEARLANTHRAADPRVDWHEYSRSERVKPEHDRVADGEIADARWKGVAVVGFAHDLRHLPPDLLRVADHTLTVGPVDAAVVMEVIRRLTGATPAGVPDNGTCAAMTPGVFRLSRKPRPDCGRLSQPSRRVDGSPAEGRQPSLGAGPPPRDARRCRLGNVARQGPGRLPCGKAQLVRGRPRRAAARADRDGEDHLRA